MSVLAAADSARPRGADPLVEALDTAVLMAAGWDPLTVTFSPDSHHRLLGYQSCRVDGCGLEAWSPSGLCGGCLARFKKQGAATDIEVFSAKGPAAPTAPGTGAAWCAASQASSARWPRTTCARAVTGCAAVGARAWLALSRATSTTHLPPPERASGRAASPPAGAWPPTRRPACAGPREQLALCRPPGAGRFPTAQLTVPA